MRFRPPLFFSEFLGVEVSVGTGEMCQRRLRTNEVRPGPAVLGSRLWSWSSHDG